MESGIIRQMQPGTKKLLTRRVASLLREWHHLSDALRPSPLPKCLQTLVGLQAVLKGFQASLLLAERHLQFDVVRLDNDDMLAIGRVLKACPTSLLEIEIDGFKRF